MNKNSKKLIVGLAIWAVFGLIVHFNPKLALGLAVVIVIIGIWVLFFWEGPDLFE